jgi:UDP-2,3-diacylglucosamine hydrolase
MLESNHDAAQGKSIALVCGAGSLPYAVADAVLRQGRRPVLFPIRGWADAAAVERYRHHWIAIGQVGRFARMARSERCREVVLIGSLVRPSLRQIRLDWQTVRVLPKAIGFYRGGDDRLLSGVAQLFEEHGFCLLGAHEIAPEILAPPGVLGRYEPGERDRADIAKGLALLAAMGPFDVGQAAVIANGQILAVEGAEGTDATLARVADLRDQGRIAQPRGTGVLVKAPKPGQDRRFDLPSIGPRTVAGIVCAGLAGMAVAGGETLVAEPDLLVSTADKAGVFVVGIENVCRR